MWKSVGSDKRFSIMKWARKKKREKQYRELRSNQMERRKKKNEKLSEKQTGAKN